MGRRVIVEEREQVRVVQPQMDLTEKNTQLKLNLTMVQRFCIELRVHKCTLITMVLICQRLETQVE